MASLFTSMFSRESDIIKHSENCYSTNVEISELMEVNPFEEQRDIDKTRIPSLIELYKDNLRKTDLKSFEFETPLVLVKCKNHDNFLLDMQQNRTNECIVDGQHRLFALKEFVGKYKKYSMLTVPVMVHLVDNINHARKIQHNLFQQKPVADYEKVKKRDYNINDVFDKTIRKFQKEYPMIARKYFRDGDYGKGCRKHHFMWDEFKKSVMNSPNISVWIEREITSTEIYNYLINRIDSLIDRLNDLDTKEEQMKFVNIPKAANYDKFVDIMDKKDIKFDILPYYYYKTYPVLTRDIELELKIIDDEDYSSESE